MAYIERKPIHRSKLRLFLGQTYYRINKYFHWWFSGNHYAKEIPKNELEYIVFTHNTPLFRKLKNVDIYLQHNKVENLKLALKKLDSIVIMPNEHFSYWKLIGNLPIQKDIKMVLYFVQMVILSLVLEVVFASYLTCFIG